MGQLSELPTLTPKQEERKAQRRADNAQRKADKKAEHDAKILSALGSAPDDVTSEEYWTFIVNQAKLYKLIDRDVFTALPIEIQRRLHGSKYYVPYIMADYEECEDVVDYPNVVDGLSL